MFGRIKPLDAILATAGKKSLHRSLGAFQLTMMGIGGIIGTGIFVLSAVAASKAGPAMMVSFIICAVVCALAALAYSELAAMLPVSGSAYTFSYATFGELAAWVVGWALVLEYAIAASTVSVGWAGYFIKLMEQFHIFLPARFIEGPYIDLRGIAGPLQAWGVGIPKEFLEAKPSAGIVNLPAVIIALLCTGLLIRGTKQSASFTSFLVVIKLFALFVFIGFAYTVFDSHRFYPPMPGGVSGFMPLGFFGSGMGVSAAAASIFFAFVGFDAVSTAAEETKNPNRNIPIGLIGSLAICTVLYLVIAAGAIGAVGADPNGGFAHAKDPLAYVMQTIGYPNVALGIRLAAGLALPSVILMMLYGQTRIFFVMARDGLLPPAFAKVHSKYQTPHVVTAVTGVFCAIFAGIFPVDQLADFSNSGTLFAFIAVALGVIVLRKTAPDRHRPFRTPAVWVVAPAAVLGCAYLFWSLSGLTKVAFTAWLLIGLVIYFTYSRSRSHLGRGHVEVHELDADAPPLPVVSLLGMD
jgi:APA family basic amino acid/polyamine antiporter